MILIAGQASTKYRVELAIHEKKLVFDGALPLPLPTTRQLTRRINESIASIGHCGHDSHSAAEPFEHPLLLRAYVSHGCRAQSLARLSTVNSVEIIGLPNALVLIQKRDTEAERRTRANRSRS